jgi:sorbitol/mannitol transport system substrate-binding protein
VNFTVLPENDVRDKISQDFANQAGQYDVATLSNYEIPIYARNGWLHEMDSYVAKDPGYDEKDVLKPMRQSLTGDDGKLYGQPFYGESSFLMYRKDVFEAKGLKMPAHPTWDQVADLAAKADGAKSGMKGICLRGLPGWGEIMAPLTTVVNTFGGTWFDKDWKARLTDPAFEKATKFYVDLVRAHGESGAPQSGFAECLNNLTQGKVAMWYDATSAAGSLEADKSPVKGKIGYAPAPVEKTESSGWLYTWAWGIQKASRNTDKAWKFVSWASSKEYEQLVGDTIGWSNVPAGKRASTYENPDYREEAGAFQEMTREAIENARPNDPGVQPRPAPGIQFVGIPEFTDLGTKVSQEISAAIAGRQSVESALKKSQKLAEQISEEYEGR